MKLINGLFFLLLPLPVFAVELGGNLGLGGTKLFNDSLTQNLIFNPSHSPYNFSGEINVNLSASDSLLELSKEDPNIEPGTYQQRVSKYYGKINQAEGVAGVTLGYRGFIVSPLLFLAQGDAILNNPAYPNASALVNLAQGWGIGYGGKFRNWSYGVSRHQFNVQTLQSDANVLEYRDGVVSTDEKYDATLWNFSVGYKLNYGQLVSNFQNTNLKFVKNNQLNLGFKSNQWNNLFAIGEIHNLDKGLNNLENQIHLGLNYELLKFINLEAGLNQLYPTYGIKFKSKFFQIYYEYGGRNQYELYRQEFKSTRVGFNLGFNLP